MEVRDRLYIDGAWVAPARTDTIDVLDSTTEEVIGTIPSGTAADVDRAIRAARAAFEGWARISAPERAKYTSRIAEGLGVRMTEISQLIAREVGTPVNLSAIIQVGLPIATFASMAEIVDQVPWEETVGNSLVVREPVGVVGAVTPWNYPLHQIAAKVAPALAAGCTVVLKPSQVAPLNAFVLAELMHEIGLPPGVFNLDSCREAGRGAGRRDGEAGRSRAGRQVSQRDPAGR